MRLGVRLGEIKPAGGWPSDEVRLYDKFEHRLLRYDTAAGGLPSGLIVQTIRCDAGDQRVTNGCDQWVTEGSRPGAAALVAEKLH